MGFSRSFLSGRDWVYLLSLLVPFIVYNLALKAAYIASMAGDQGLASALGLVRSDAFFDLGYALLWIDLFSVTRGMGLARRAVILLFHASTMLVLIVTTCAHQYYAETGTTLDYGVVALFLPSPGGEILPLLLGVPALAWVVLFAVLFYAALGPLLVTRAIEQWRGRPGRSPAGRPRASLLGLLGLFLLASGFSFLSLLIGVSPVGASKSFARDPVVNLVVTGVEDSGAEENAGSTVESPAAHAKLAPTPQTEKRNVVLIHL